MKREIITAAILITQILPLHAQDSLVTDDENGLPKVEQAAPQEAPLQEIGLEDQPAKKPIDESNLQNWLFAAGTLILGAIAAVVVGSSQGAAPTDSSQDAAKRP
jgi:hypothetical protein